MKVKCTFFGQCVSRDYKSTQCVCPICEISDKYAPICGDNGKTYANECWLRRDSCILQKPLTIAAYESCGIKEKYDILVALDSSRNVDQTSMGYMTDYIKALTQSFPISPDTTRFGIMQYTENDIRYVLKIEDGTSVKAISKALYGIRTLNGMKGIHQLPTYIQSNDIFNFANQRADAKRIVVVITTGLEQDSNAANTAFDTETRQAFKDIHSDTGADVITMVIGDEKFLPKANEIVSNKRDVLFMPSILGIPGSLGDLETLIGYKKGICYIFYLGNL